MSLYYDVYEWKQFPLSITRVFTYFNEYISIGELIEAADKMFANYHKSGSAVTIPFVTPADFISTSF